jgi:hypothetical protein
MFVAVLLAGCGGSSSSGGTKAANPNAKETLPPGDIPDNQAFVAYAPSGASYSLKVPEGWSRRAQGGVVTFSANLNRIQVQERKAAGTLSAGAVKATLPKLAKSIKGFSSAQVSTVSRPAGHAVRIAYLATAPTDAVTGRSGVDEFEQYLFVRNGRELVLTLSAPKGSDNVDPWRVVTTSVRWK